VAIADGPVLEGAVLGAVEASLGSPLSCVLQVIRGAAELRKVD
ncbi:MAG: PTS mannose transporter subunit IID, partial [Synergistales bacterium]|nr:PTS mannose transporter subunit IID [Synergistales bacterium]